MASNGDREYIVRLPKPHAKQDEFIHCGKPRIICRAGRRSGKTIGVSMLAVEKFLAGRRILYCAPTQEQVGRFWTEVSRALAEPIQAGVFYKNETLHLIELQGTEQRIRAKTGWSADSLRGDYADLLILDEWQLMNEDAWQLVGAPMLLDNNGDAVFIYTPPSLHSRSISKANDPQHAAKLFKRAAADGSGRWGAFHFTSRDNPFLSQAALADIAADMTALAYRMEIMAEDVDEAPGALWKRETIDKSRVSNPLKDAKGNPMQFNRIVVGVDPSATSGGDEAGIITAGRIGKDFYVLSDDSLQGSPQAWGMAAVRAYHASQANLMVAESNNGGEMVEHVIKTIDPRVQIKLVHASRGKQTRAEPIAAIYEQGRGHHVGRFDKLEDEMVLWVPGDPSPNRMDATVWSATELMLDQKIMRQVEIEGF